MQVLSFNDFLQAFYTELQRVFVDEVETVVLSNVNRTPDVPIRLNLCQRESSVFKTHADFMNLSIVQNDNNSRPTP